MQTISIRREILVAPVPLTAKMVSIATENKMIAATIVYVVGTPATIKSLSLVKMESTAVGKSSTTIPNIIANAILMVATFLISGITSSGFFCPNKLLTIEF